MREIRSLPRVKAQGVHIFGAIDKILATLDDPEVTNELVHDLERDHRVKTRGFNKFHYDVCLHYDFLICRFS